MARILSFILLTLCVNAVQAQRFYKGLSLGVQATKAQYFDSVTKKPTTFQQGARIAFLGKINLEGKLSFAPEIAISSKGFKVANPVIGKKEQTITAYSVDVILMQEYAFTKQFYAKIGPSFTGIINGKQVDVSTSGTVTSKKLPMNFGEWSRFDAEINVALGINLPKNFLVELRAAKSLSNAWNGDDNKNVKHIIYGLSVGKYLR